MKRCDTYDSYYEIEDGRLIQHLLNFDGSIDPDRGVDVEMAAFDLFELTEFCAIIGELFNLEIDEVAGLMAKTPIKGIMAPNVEVFTK